MLLDADGGAMGTKDEAVLTHGEAMRLTAFRLEACQQARQV